MASLPPPILLSSLQLPQVVVWVFTPASDFLPQPLAPDVVTASTVPTSAAPSSTEPVKGAHVDKSLLSKAPASWM